MSLARLALGSEAVLLQTRRVHAAGFLRLFACPQVEILAAVDSGSSRPAAAGARNAPAGRAGGEAGTERVGTATRCGGGGAQRGAGPRDDPTSDWRSEVAALRREVASMRLQLGALGCNGAGGGQHAGTYPGGPHRPPSDGASGETEAPCLSHPADPSEPSMEMAHRLLADLMTCPIEIRDGACTVTPFRFDDTESLSLGFTPSGNAYVISY